MKLVIVESPNKCQTISRHLGAGYKVMASKGHICDLASKGAGGLGIDVKDGFKASFVIPPAKTATVKALKAAADEADDIYLATDPDREGEAISWHLARILGLPIETTKRMRFHEITKPAILEAMENVSHIDMDLVNAQETRRIYDRVIGYKLSNLLQKKINCESAGRVQSVTLRMVVDNDREIKGFKPEEYWTITAKVQVGTTILELPLTKVDGKEPKIATAEQAAAIVARIGDSLSLKSLVRSKKTVVPKPPFTTSTMQQEAYNRYKFSTSLTQSLAQKLYEGLSINGEHVGLITYLRTDSTRISPVFFEKHAKPYIKEAYGEEFIGRIRNSKKSDSIQDAHEAIRPTGTHRTPAVVSKYVSANEAKLYKLIYDRAMASCMSDKVEEVTVALFESNGLTFKASASTTLFPGYTVIYKTEDDEQNAFLPDMQQGDCYGVVSIDKKQNFTKAPSRLSEAKIVKLMEEEGVGRPSTYASTIKTLVNRKYIVSKGGVVTPTEEGIRTTLSLEKWYPEIVSSSYTSNMEKTLDEIENGKLDRLTALNAFYFPFIEKFEKVSKEWQKENKVVGVCPKCGKPLVQKKSRFGPFIACSDFKNCRYIQKDKQDKFTGEMCPKCGKPLIERAGKRGTTFIGCSGYPYCDYTQPSGGQEAPKKKTEYTEKDYIKPCPSCHSGHLVLKHGKRTDFYGCTNFPRCQYKEWINTKFAKKK